MFDNLLTSEQKNFKNKCFDFLKSDNPFATKDIKWFDSFNLNYKINNLGFRDIDIDVKNLNNRIFVIGDSMTLGLGLPYEQTWPVQLEKLIDKDIIKIAWQSVSNDWMIKVFDIIKNFNPTDIFIQFTLIQRKTVFNEDHVEHYELDEDIFNNKNFEKNFIAKFDQQLDYIIKESSLRNIKTFITFVPSFYFISGNYGVNYFKKKILENSNENFIFYKRFFNKEKSMLYYKNINDLARDEFHFGKITCQEIANNFFKTYEQKTLNT